MSSGTSYGGGLGGLLSSLSGAEDTAQHHAGSSGDKDLFSSILSSVSGKESQLQDEDVDEEDMVNSHDSYYGSGAGTGGSATSGGMGKAAAMQAMKMFNQGQTGSGGGSGGKGALIGMAMGQAAKLFGMSLPPSPFNPRTSCAAADWSASDIDQQSSAGNVSSEESKQSAVQQAGEMALKMYLKSEMGGGGSSGGSGLMGLASKFMK